MDKDILVLIGTIPWIFFLMVVLFFNYGNKNKNRRLRYLFWFVFIFAAVRYGIGYDYFSYKDLVEGRAPEYELDRVEYFSQLLILFSRPLHYQVYFALSSFLTIFPVYYVCKKLSVNPIYSFTIYILFPLFFLEGLSIIRNAIAFSMVLLMFYCIYKKRILLSVIFLIVAMGFHISAIVAVIIYPIYYLIRGRKLHLILYIISFFLPLIIMPILTSYFSDLFLVAKITRNIENEITKVGGIFYYVINCMALFNIIYWNRLVKLRDENKVYLSLVNVGVCVWNCFLSIDPTTASRLSIYFLVFTILLAPFYKILFKNKVKKLAFSSFFVMLFVASLLLNMYAFFDRGREMSNLPYQVFFLNPTDAFYHINYE